MDETIISRMNARFAKMSKSHKEIAKYITQNYEQAAFMTAAAMGQALSISESTVVRFAAALGYDGYPELQKALEVWIKGKLSSVSRIGAKYANSSQKELFSEVLRSDMERIADTIDRLDTQTFDHAVDIILNAENVYIIGLRSCAPLAEMLAFYLNMIRGQIILISSTNVSELFEQMIRINEKDAIIAISFPRYSMRTLKALEFASDRLARSITITDTIHSPMNMYSSCNLLARSDMVSIVDSLVAPLSLINALIIALCLKSPDAVNKHLDTLQKTWNNYQVYLDDEIVFVNDKPITDYATWKDKE